ncbi:MAG: archease [Planctomycetota bacterium]
MRYKLINHTADIGIRLGSKTLKGLFEDAAFALFDILCDIKKVRASFKRTISVESGNREELLNEFLNTLLKEFTLENNLVGKVKIKSIDSNNALRLVLSAVIQGEPYDPKRHTIKTEIKAVTFHNLSIKKTSGGYTAEVVFDV